MTWYYIHIAPSLYGIRERNNIYNYAIPERFFTTIIQCISWPPFSLTFLYISHYQERGNGRINNLSALHHDLSAPTLEIFRCPTVTPSRKSVPWVPREWLPPGPHSHRTRGYLCSFPITWTPLSREKDIQRNTPLSRILVTVGTYKKTPPFPGYLGKSSREYGQKIPPFPEKMGTRMRPLMHSSGGLPRCSLGGDLRPNLGIYVAVTGSRWR